MPIFFTEGYLDSRILVPHCLHRSLFYEGLQYVRLIQYPLSISVPFLGHFLINVVVQFCFFIIIIQQEAIICSVSRLSTSVGQSSGLRRPRGCEHCPPCSEQWERGTAERRDWSEYSSEGYGRDTVIDGLGTEMKVKECYAVGELVDTEISNQ